jgi:hypothetical protein
MTTVQPATVPDVRAPERDTLAAALRYAQAGWPVFPCRPDGTPFPLWKAPLTEHGYLDASADPAAIRAWWSRWPRANVAIATGSPAVDVLDVDVKPNGSGFAAFNTLKRAGLLSGATTLVRTRSGGLHVYYTGTPQGCHALPRHFLDFKAAGGYVLAPPSRVGGQPYELLDQRPGTAALDWAAVTALLDPPRPARRAGPVRPLPPGELPPAVQRALQGAAKDRSAALHRLVGACIRSGLDETATHQLAAGYEPAMAKYGPRLHAEVNRSLTRIGTR